MKPPSLFLRNSKTELATELPVWQTKSKEGRKSKALTDTDRRLQSLAGRDKSYAAHGKPLPGEPLFSSLGCLQYKQPSLKR